MKKNYISAPREEAVRIICTHLNYAGGTETVPLPDALHRIAATDIGSINTLPNTLNSRWDCIVFYYDRWLRDKGDTSAWQRDIDYSYANTGVGIRGNWDTGVKVEHTRIDENGKLVLLEREIVRGQNTQPVGEWLKKDEVVVKKGAKILPAHLNILASAGITTVPVYRKPKVGFLATGNELVPRGGNASPP